MSDPVLSSESAGWRAFFAEGRLPRFLLILLGVWMNAADSLVTATIMPSVARDLGGFGLFSWAVAGFLVGSVLAGASSGRLAERFGLRTATALSGLCFAAGCAMSAAAPTIHLFLAGRVIQGFGSGWISGFAMVAIAQIFPERHLARMFAAVAAVWGIATMLGPLIGGLFAEAGHWRAVFWLFLGQALLFTACAPLLLRGSAPSDGSRRIPLLQLLLVAGAVGCMALANTSDSTILSVILIVAGFAALALVLRIDRNAASRLLPHRAADPRTLVGAGYIAMFAVTAASMAFDIYAPPILQQLRGLTPLEAGYVTASLAVAWTLTAFAVAGVGQEGERRWIVAGVLAIALGAIAQFAVMHRADIPLIALAGAIMGAGFGLSSSLVNRAILRALEEEDRNIGSAALISIRETGGAVGAAVAGTAANLAGFAEGLSDSAARGAAIGVFATAVPLALIGLWATLRMVRVAR